MRRLALAILVAAALALTAQPAGAQQVPDLPDLPDLVALFDPDGEPCTGVPNQVPGLFNFTAACQAHDACYVAGGNNLACDQAFRQDLRSLCLAQYPQVTDPRRYTCLALAELYYFGVRLFGPIVFP
jgi:hypothetical protein